MTTSAVRRLYFYVAAFIGLQLVISGSRSLMIVLLESVFLTASIASTDQQLGLITSSVAMLVVGLGLWLVHWLVIQRGQGRDDEQRSTLRRLYLYAVLVISALVGLFSGFTILRNVLQIGTVAFDGYSLSSAIGTTTIQTPLGAETFELIHAPGHHSDMYVVYHPASALMWAADMLSDLEIPFVEQHLGDYRRTLTRLSELHVEILVPGHGNWTSERDEILTRFTRDQTYLAEVDETVRACLAEGLGVEETLERCARIAVNRPEQNSSAHRDNVESAWLELGGKGDAAALGWGKYYSGYGD